MEQEKTNKNRRAGVILTLISLIAVVIIFEYGKLYQRNLFLIVVELAIIIIFLISLTLTYVKTGLWKFTHKPLNKLDEREIALTSKSLRYTYGIFTVIVLILLLSLAIMEINIDIVLVVSLILFAHILPASIIAWTEKTF